MSKVRAIIYLILSQLFPKKHPLFIDVDTSEGHDYSCEIKMVYKRKKNKYEVISMRFHDSKKEEVKEDE